MERDVMALPAEQMSVDIDSEKAQHHFKKIEAQKGSRGGSL